MRRAALAVLLLGASQWSAAGLFSDDEAHKKIADQQKQIQALETRVMTAEGQMQTQTKGLMDLLAQIDALKAELGRLQGQNEVYAHDIEATQKRQRDLYVDLDGRLRKLERTAVPVEADKSSVPPPSGEAPVGAPPVAAVPPAAVPSPPPALGDESKAYEAALNQFKVGNYQGAVVSFQQFIAAFPGSTLASSAQYWIGNSYFNLRDYKSAISAQHKLISLYPSSSKVPDALLNVASCQQGLGEMSAARKTLEELVAKHPISNAADIAKKRLANMR